MIYATELIDATVFDADNNYVGRIRDLCLIPSVQNSRVARLVIARGRYQTLVASHTQLSFISPGTIRLNTGELQLATYVPDQSWLTFRGDLLDRQIIDTAGRKVVRVNDLDLTEHRQKEHIEMHVAYVDVGLAGAFRRLLKGVASSGWLRAVQERIPTSRIPWDVVDVIETDPLRRVKLKLPKSKLPELHPADIADILEDLAPAQQEAVLESLDDETAAEALEEVEDAVQVRILESLDRERIAHILENMHSDEAVDALAELSAGTTRQVLNQMEWREARELIQLMQFEQDTAGGMMTTEVFALDEQTTVAEAVEQIRRKQEELVALDVVPLKDGTGKYSGLVTTDTLLLSPSSAVLGELREEQPVSVEPDATEHDVIELFDKYNLRSLPVVDPDGQLAGIITVDDIVSRLWQRRN